MMSAILARLGIDSGNFRSGLKQADAEKQKFANNHTAAAERILKSDNKVEHNLVGMVERLKDVNSAGDLATNAMDAFADSIDLSLGAAVTAGIFIAFVRGLQSISEEAAKTREELAALLSPSQGGSDFSSLSELDARLAKLQERLNTMSKTPSFWDATKEFIGSARLLGGEGGSPQDVADRRTADADAVRKQIEDARAAIAAKAKANTNVMELEARGMHELAEIEKVRLEYAEKIGAAIRAQNSGVADELRSQQALAEAEVHKKAAEEIRDFERKQLDEFLEYQKDAAKEKTDFERDQYKDFVEFQKDENKSMQDQAEKQYKDFVEFKKDEDKKAADEKKKADEEAAKTEKLRKENVTKNEDDRVDQFVEDKLAGPAEAAARRRAERKANSLAARAGREQALRDRGGRSQADVDEQAARDKRMGREPGETMPPKEDRKDDLAGAIDQTAMAKDIKTIANK